MRISDWSSDVCSSDLFAVDLPADAAKAEDAEAAAADGAGQGHALLQPLALAHVAVAVADLARGGEQQGDRHVGDVVVQHVGRVGDDDVAPGGVREIDGVDPDAVAADRKSTRLN